jgi:hypothetical protein
MTTPKPTSVPTIGSRVVPGAVIPQPTNPAQWLELGRALDAELRSGFGIPAAEHTVAVGWTSIPGLRERRFVGGSRRIRETAALPMPSPHLMAPRSNAQFLDHAEQDVANAFIDAVSGLRHVPDLSSHWLRIYVSHAEGPCAACAQGLMQRQVDPGVLGQLSLMYPALLIHLFWQTQAGKLGSVMIEGGARL